MSFQSDPIPTAAIGVTNATCNVVVSEAVKAGQIAVKQSGNSATFGLPPDYPSAGLRPIYQPEAAANFAYKPIVNIANNVSSVSDASVALLTDGSMLVSYVYLGATVFNYIYNSAGSYLSQSSVPGTACKMAALKGGGYVILYAAASGLMLSIRDANHTVRGAGPILLEAANTGAALLGNLTITNNGNVFATWTANSAAVATPKFAVFGADGSVIKAASTLRAGIGPNSGTDLAVCRALAGGNVVMAYTIANGLNPGAVVRYYRIYDSSGVAASDEVMWRTSVSQYGEIACAALSGGGFALLDRENLALSVFSATGVVLLASTNLDAGYYPVAAMTALDDGALVLLWYGSANSVIAAYVRGDGTGLSQRVLRTNALLVGGPLWAIPLQGGRFVLAHADETKKVVSYAYDAGPYWALVKSTTYEFMPVGVMARRMPGLALINPVNPAILTWAQFVVSETGTLQMALCAYLVPATVPEGVFLGDSPSGATAKVQVTGYAQLSTPCQTRFSVDARTGTNRAGIKIIAINDLAFLEI